MEKNITTYNLARMNMLLHGVKDTEFEIYHGDTLTNDWDYLRETRGRSSTPCSTSLAGRARCCSTCGDVDPTLEKPG